MSNPIVLDAKEVHVGRKVVQAMHAWVDHHNATIDQAVEVLVETLLEEASANTEFDFLAAMQDAFGCDYIMNAGGEDPDDEADFDADREDDLDEDWEDDEDDDLDEDDEDDDLDEDWEDDEDDDLDEDDEDDEDDDLDDEAVGDVDWEDTDEDDED